MTTTICDIDPRIGPRLDLRVGGDTYLLAAIEVPSECESMVRIWTQRHEYGERWMLVAAGDVEVIRRH